MMTSFISCIVKVGGGEIALWSRAGGLTDVDHCFMNHFLGPINTLTPSFLGNP